MLMLHTVRHADYYVLNFNQNTLFELNMCFTASHYLDLSTGKTRAHFTRHDYLLESCPRIGDFGQCVLLCIV